MGRVADVQVAVTDVKRRVRATVSDLQRRLLFAGGLVFLVILWGSLGFYLIGGGRWTLLDSA
jgi:hypothetical protein